MTRTSIRLRGLAVVAAVVAVLAVSACGEAQGDEVASAGGEQNAPNPAQTWDTAQSDPDTQALLFAQCMRDNGVDMPDPAPGQQGLIDAFQSIAGNYDRSTLEQAIAACQSQMPQYAEEQQHSNETMLALAECLREQGLDVSDNPFDDAHSGAVDQNEFIKAMEVCRDVLIKGGGQ
jgi:hypothetical protein